MAGIGKLIQEFAYTPNGPQPIIALGEKDARIASQDLGFVSGTVWSIRQLALGCKTA